MNTTLAHWTLHWRDARCIPERARDSVQKITKSIFRYKIKLPTGRSFARSLTFLRCQGKKLSQQKKRWDALLKKFPKMNNLDWGSLAAPLPSPSATRMHVLNDHCISATILSCQDDAAAAYARRKFNFKDSCAHHEYLVFTEKFRKEGYGTKMMDSVASHYLAAGLSEIRLTAGLTGGGAVWTKFGFRPTNSSEWIKVKKTVERNLKSINNDARIRFQEIYNESLEEKLKTILKYHHPQAIWTITDIDKRKAFTAKNGFQHGLSGHLLRNSRWKGILNLNDEDSRHRLEAYLASKA